MFHSVPPIQNKIWFSQHLLPSVAQNAEIEELPKLLVSQFTVRWHCKGAASTLCCLGTGGRSPWLGWRWAWSRFPVSSRWRIVGTGSVWCPGAGFCVLPTARAAGLKRGAPWRGLRPGPSARA